MHFHVQSIKACKTAKLLGFFHWSTQWGCTIVYWPKPWLVQLNTEPKAMPETSCGQRTAYRTHSKNSSTQNFVRRKSSVQVDSNCDQFPASLIPVIRLWILSGGKVLFGWMLIVTNFRFLYPWLHVVLHENEGYARNLTRKVFKHCTYCSEYKMYVHKQLLHTCPPCYQLLASNKMLCQLSEPVHLSKQSAFQNRSKLSSSL